MLGRDVFVAEPAGLLLAELEDALRPRVERQRPAPDPGPLAEDPGQLVAERGQVDAEPPERLGGDAVIRLDEGVEQVLGVEDGRLHALGRALGGRDGPLCLFGIAIELHPRFSGSQVEVAVRWSAPGDRAGRSCRGTRGRPRPPRRRAGRQDDPGPGVEVAGSVARRCGMPWPFSRNRWPFWVPAGTRRRTLPLSVVTGTSAPRSASARVSGSSRSRSAPVRAKTGWGRTRIGRRGRRRSVPGRTA